MEKFCMYGFTWLFATLFLLGLTLLFMLVSLIFYSRNKDKVFFTFLYSMLVPMCTSFFMLMVFKFSDNNVSCEAMRKMDVLAIPTVITALISGVAVFIMLKRKLKN